MKKVKDRQPTKQKSGKTRHDVFQISERQKQTNRHTSSPINKEQKGMWESQAECENMQTQKQKQNSRGKNRQSKKGKQTKNISTQLLKSVLSFKKSRVRCTF